MPEPFTLGTILDDGNRYLVVWDALADGTRLAMPLTRQTAPLHRAQVVLALDEAEQLTGQRAAWIIDTRKRLWLDAPQPRIVAQADSSLIGRIARTFDRARAAANFEGREP